MSKAALCVSTAVVFALLTSPAAALVDCALAIMPPPRYSTTIPPGVVVKHMPLAALNQQFKAFYGARPATVEPPCYSIIGFTMMYATKPFVMYLPNDVSAPCYAQIRRHEAAHANGWPHNHPGGIPQKGFCRPA